MNQRNMEALRGLLREVSTVLIGDGPSEEVWFADIAHRLASRGVLVPSSLTGDEAADIGGTFEMGWYVGGPDDMDANTVAGREVFVQGLERIAKGEAP